VNLWTVLSGILAGLKEMEGNAGWLTASGKSAFEAKPECWCKRKRSYRSMFRRESAV